MKVKASRRRFIQGLASLLALGALPLRLLARATGAFNAEETADVYQALFGDMSIVETDDIRLKIPDIAENGAVVPVSVSTGIPGAEAIHIVIDENPNPLSASFLLSKRTPADISVRVKMGRSSMVRALVKTSDKVYMKGQEVKVTIGGCGG